MFCQKRIFPARGGVKIEEISGEQGDFTLTSDQKKFHAKRILLAIGRRGTPRKLGVPGEDSGKVFYRLLEPEKFARNNLLVVGGGDSAVEAAVSLSEQEGSTVHLSYRRDKIFRIKDGNRIRLEEAVQAGKIQMILRSEVVRIKDQVVFYKQDDEEISIPNDFVFVFAGGILPTEFLKNTGIEFTRKFGEA